MASKTTLARRLFEEVAGSFETVHGIMVEFGDITLVDLWWLAHELVLGSGSIAPNEGSRIGELLRRLPSAEEFLAFVQDDSPSA
jgi:hypothetical protein